MAEDKSMTTVYDKYGRSRQVHAVDARELTRVRKGKVYFFSSPPKNPVDVTEERKVLEEEREKAKRKAKRKAARGKGW